MSFFEQCSYFSCAYQEVAKYTFSIQDNITMSNSNILDENKIKEILTSLDFDYTRFKNGLNTVIGEEINDSQDLSGGEWQKISIARMLYSERDFYIMDEPTASLDPLSESKLYKQLKDSVKEKGCLIIAHRLGITELCDKIFVLSNGKIVESGSMKDLLEKEGLYSKMYEKQKKWYKK